MQPAPTTPSPEQQQATDHQHLRLLGIFHYIYGGLSLLGVLFVVGHFLVMRFVLSQATAQAARTGSSDAAELAQLEQFFSVFIIFYILAGVFCLVGGIGNILTGRFLRHHRHRVFILIFAGLNCLNMPLGTTLGIFTFLVLFRPSVTDEFNARGG